MHGIRFCMGFALAGSCLAACSTTNGAGSALAGGPEDSAKGSTCAPMAALESAAQADAVSQMARLLTRRGDVAADDERSDAALLWTAVSHGSTKVAKLLLRRGTVNLTRDRPWLHRAAHGGGLGLAELLLEAGAPLDASDREGRTALHAAASLPSPELAQLLLERGADVDATDNLDWTPLHVALYRGAEKAVRALAEETALVLLKAGASVNAQTLVVGWRPLHLAAWLRRPHIVAALLAKGAEVNATMRLGDWTPLHIALKLQSPPAERLVAIMREAGAIDKGGGAEVPPVLFGTRFGPRAFPLVQPVLPILPRNRRYHSNIVRGAFTEAGASERLVSLSLYYDPLDEGFANLHALVDKEGTTHFLWSSNSLGFELAGLCRDGPTGRDHVIYRFSPGGSCCWPHHVYMYWDAAHGGLVEGFDDYHYPNSLAEPSADGQCRWREAVAEARAARGAFKPLRAHGGEILQENGVPSVLPFRTIPEEVVQENLSVLRSNATASVSEPFAPRENSDTVGESPRWEVLHVSRSGLDNYVGYRTGVTLVHDRRAGGWRSILDCEHVDFQVLRDNELLLKVWRGCSPDPVWQTHGIKIDLVTLETQVIEHPEEWERLIRGNDDTDHTPDGDPQLGPSAAAHGRAPTLRLELARSGFVQPGSASSGP